MIEAIDAVVAQTAMGGSRWPEDFARKTVLQLDRLALHEHLFGARWRPVRGTVERVRHFDLLLDVGRLILGGSWDNAWVAEGRPEERAERKNEQNPTDGWDGWCDPLCQERTVEHKKQHTGARDQYDREIKHTRVWGRHQVSVAEELIPTGENFPFFRYFLTGCHSVFLPSSRQRFFFSRPIGCLLRGIS